MKALLIHSCSKYSELWPFLVESWENLIYTYDLKFDKLYISCDSKDVVATSEFSNLDWNLVVYDGDLSWSAAALDVSYQLQTLGVTQLLTSFEDILPVSIDKHLFDRIQSIDSYSYVRTLGDNLIFRANLLRSGSVRNVTSRFPYLGSMLLSFWDINCMIKVLSSPMISTASPWLYERKCHFAMHDLIQSGKVYETNKRVFKFCNICKKGKIDRLELATYCIYKAFNQYDDSIKALNKSFKLFSIPRNLAIFCYTFLVSILSMFGFLNLKYLIFHR